MGAVRVLFLGRLQDLPQGRERDLPAPLGWDGLLDAVVPSLADDLRSSAVRIAHQGELLRDNTTLLAQAGDEVALLPPVSGG